MVPLLSSGGPAKACTAGSPAAELVPLLAAETVDWIFAGVPTVVPCAATGFHNLLFTCTPAASNIKYLCTSSVDGQLYAMT